MKVRNMLFVTMVGAIVLAGCQTQNKSTNEPAESNNNSSQASTKASSETAGNKINWSLQQAVERFEETYPKAAVTGLQLDTSFGRYFYEIEGVDDDKEYEATVNAETGELKKEKEEQLDADERNGVKKQEEALDLSDILSIEKVSKIAEKEAQKGQAQDWQLEKENNVTYWEVKVADKTAKAEIKIDAKTGKVLEID